MIVEVILAEIGKDAAGECQPRKALLCQCVGGGLCKDIADTCLACTRQKRGGDLGGGCCVLRSVRNAGNAVFYRADDRTRCFFGEDGFQTVCHRGFAVGAGHRIQLQLLLRMSVVSKACGQENGGSVADQDPRKPCRIGSSDRTRIIDDRADSAGCACLRYGGVSVVVPAADTEVYIPGADTAGIALRAAAWDGKQRGIAHTEDVGDGDVIKDLSDRHDYSPGFQGVRFSASMSFGIYSMRYVGETYISRRVRR